MSGPLQTTSLSPSNLALAFKHHAPATWKAKSYPAIRGGTVDSVYFKRKHSDGRVGCTVTLFVPTGVTTIAPNPELPRAYWYKFITAVQFTAWEWAGIMQLVDPGNWLPHWAERADTPQEQALLVQHVNGKTHFMLGAYPLAENTNAIDHLEDLL